MPILDSLNLDASKLLQSLIDLAQYNDVQFLFNQNPLAAIVLKNFVMPSQGLKKLVLITGASSGTGAEVAKIFSHSGYPTVLLARKNVAYRRY